MPHRKEKKEGLPEKPRPQGLCHHPYLKAGKIAGEKICVYCKCVVYLNPDFFKSTGYGQ